MKIDFVITWVDGNDPQWQKQKNEYKKEKSGEATTNRYRDMGILKYWFRAVTEYAPWVNRVFFITWGHLPEWLNTDCEKLQIIRHEDYIPEQYLPTFSSRPIELNLHRIPGLGEHFVYFNDDMLLNRPVSPEFFFRKGLPCDFLHVDDFYYSDVSDSWAHAKVNCTWTVNNHLSYLKSFLRFPLKYVNLCYPFKNNLKNIYKLEHGHAFPGFRDHHMASPYLTSVFDEVWREAGAELDKTCTNKFRTPFDINSYIFRYWQLAIGKFYPVSQKMRGKYFGIRQDNSELINELLHPKHHMVCINDNSLEVDFEEVKQELIRVLERKLPKKSEFEL